MLLWLERTAMPARYAGCNPDEHLGSGWSDAAFAHLLALTSLRCAAGFVRMAPSCLHS